VKALAVTTGTLFVLLFIGLARMYYHEDTVSSYETHSGAVHDGAIERGWIPAFMPPTARDLREVHNIDSNRQWIRFTVPASDAREMVGTLRRVEAPESVRKPPRWSGPWLPKPDPEMRDMSISYHQDPSPGLGARCLAVRWTDPATVYAWTC
jgi:hypothetical protein